MTLLSAVTLLGFLAACVSAWSLGGALGGGILAGYLLGAALTTLGSLHQRQVLARAPERALAALTASFLAKLAALLLGGLALRFLPAVGERLDWRSFLVAFAAAVVLLLPVGTLGAVRVLRRAH
jgi:hypothetical protein